MYAKEVEKRDRIAKNSALIDEALALIPQVPDEIFWPDIGYRGGNPFNFAPPAWPFGFGSKPFEYGPPF